MNYDGEYMVQTGMAVQNTPTQTNARILDHPRILYGGRLMPDGRTVDRNPETVVSLRSRYTRIFGNRIPALGRSRWKLEYAPKAVTPARDDQSMGIYRFRSVVCTRVSDHNIQQVCIAIARCIETSWCVLLALSNRR